MHHVSCATAGGVVQAVGNPAAASKGVRNRRRGTKGNYFAVLSSSCGRGIIFASVVPIRFAHIEMNKPWALKAAVNNWIANCHNTTRKTRIKQLENTILITNRQTDCMIDRFDSDTMECKDTENKLTPKDKMPTKNQIVATLAAPGNMFTSPRLRNRVLDVLR